MYRRVLFGGNGQVETQMQQPLTTITGKSRCGDGARLFGSGGVTSGTALVVICDITGSPGTTNETESHTVRTVSRKCIVIIQVLASIK